MLPPPPNVFNKFHYHQVIAATNRVDILDPALLRSGRLDRKIEFPHPNEDARARIMQIHSRKMNVSSEVKFLIDCRNAMFAKTLKNFL